MKYLTEHEIKNLKEQNNRYSINYIGKLYSTMSVPTHSHKLWEIIYISKKRCIITVENQNFELKTGDIIIIPPNFKHSDQSETGYDNYHLNVKSLNMLYQTPVVLHDNAKKHFKELLEQTTYSFHSDIKNKEGILNAYYTLIVNYILSMNSDVKETNNTYVKTIESEIISNISNTMFDLKGYLDSQPFNPEYLRQLFIKHMGVSPHKYLLNKRITYAQQLLLSIKNLNLSIKEISEMCGFTDPLYFSRIFKKTYGLSPTDFVKKSNN